MICTGPESEHVAQSLEKMQATLEKNGKPCCLNLITDNDSKFLAKIAKEKRIQEVLIAEQ